MIFLNSILGVISILCGIWLINYYRDLKQKNKIGISSKNLQNGGIGLIMIGIALLIRDFRDLVNYLNQWTL